MYLEKICVPDFRALKNVEICFEREFTPSIFPLGSLNGGGKSTLLQLIFVLLHCSVNPDRIAFLKNLLNGFKTYKNSEKRTLAIIDIWEGTKTVQLEFFTCKETFVQSFFNDNSLDKKDYKNKYKSYRVSNELKKLNTQVFYLQKNIKKTEEIRDRIRSFRKAGISLERSSFLQSLLMQIEEITSSDLVDLGSNHSSILSSIREFKSRRDKDLSNEDIEKLLKLVIDSLELSRLNLQSTSLKIKELEFLNTLFLDSLKDNKMIYICETLSANEEQEQSEILICSLKNIDINEATPFLKKISEKTFLAAHVSQVFLFLSLDSRKALFKAQAKKELSENDYYAQLRKEKSKLPGFFTYDFLAVDILIESFIKARDLDFIKAVETGEYGSSYKLLLEDLNSVLSNKKININKDLSGVTFKVNTDDIELYPEDLSHGELKRLCIYMWIKHNKIEDSIVLMDEIEIAFHADWQYQIVRDIEQWSPTSQYILATHSYELCQAVTPAHVKELEPKLIKNVK